MNLVLIACALIRVTYLITRAHKAKRGKMVWKNEGEWTEKWILGQGEEMSGSGRSMHGHILTYSRL